MKKEFFALFLFVSLASASVSVCAQDAAPTISAGRPGMATGTDICPAGKLQWETGVGFERNDGEKTWTLNTSSLRFGLSDFAEVNLGIDAQSVRAGGSVVRGVTPLVIASKAKLMDAHSWLPDVGLLVSLALPTGKSDFRPDNAAPAIYLLFHNDLTDRLGLDYNVGAEWDGFSSSVTTFATACFSLELSDKWGVFVESYNYFSRGASADCYADFGVTMVPCRRLQFDLSANVSLTDFKNYLGVGFGVSWLIN